MRTILLDATYEPLSIISWKKAFRLIFDVCDNGNGETKAEMLYSYPNRYIHSTTSTFKWPAVIVLKRPSKRKRNSRIVSPSTKSILVRDLYTCQYCGCKLSNKSGTKDHVIPESKGGPTSWENLVACCRTCQDKKADKYPDECNMYPKTKPKSPSFEERFFSSIKVSNANERKTWKFAFKQIGLLDLVERM